MSVWFKPHWTLPLVAHGRPLGPAQWWSGLPAPSLLPDCPHVRAGMWWVCVGNGVVFPCCRMAVLFGPSWLLVRCLLAGYRAALQGCCGGPCCVVSVQYGCAVLMQCCSSAERLVLASAGTLWWFLVKAGSMPASAPWGRLCLVLSLPLEHVHGGVGRLPTSTCGYDAPTSP